MREGNAPLVRREDYAAPPFWIRKVDLTFELDPAKTMVINRMQIERNGAVAAGPLKLHGEDITLTRCLANGESVSFRHEDGLLVIDHLPEGSFTLEIRNTCAPERNTRLSGLYTSMRRLLHAVRGRGLSPHHLLPRPARRDGRVHGADEGEQGGVSGAALERQPGRARRPRRTAATSPSGTTRSPSRATCSRSSPPTWSRASSTSARAPARITCCRSTCAAATSTRPSTR